MRDPRALYSLVATETRRSGWPEDGRAFGLDDQREGREMPGLETRQSDDPVLRIRRLVKEKLSTLGPYHRAAIIPGGS